MNVNVSTRLPISSRVAWITLVRADTFLYITRGLMRYEGSEDWPETLMATGVEISTTAYPFSILPGTDHTFRIMEVDDKNQVIQTEEHGGVIRKWNHTMKLTPISVSECRYADLVEIHAGIFTVPIWIFANVFYRVRHSRWRKLARKLRKDASV